MCYIRQMRRKVRSLKRLLKDKSKAIALAEACDTKFIYLWQLSQGHRRASVELAKLLEEESERLFGSEWLVPKRELRPDVWAA